MPTIYVTSIEQPTLTKIIVWQALTSLFQFHPYTFSRVAALPLMHNNHHRRNIGFCVIRQNVAPNIESTQTVVPQFAKMQIMVLVAASLFLLCLKRSPTERTYSQSWMKRVGESHSLQYFNLCSSFCATYRNTAFPSKSQFEMKVPMQNVTPTFSPWIAIHGTTLETPQLIYVDS